MAHSLQTLLFPSVARREVVARFDGGDITSDAGALLIARADRKIGLTQASQLESRQRQIYTAE